MNIHYLATLCAVIDCGSFSAAAKKLTLTQPAVSQHIKAVERAFGGPLLNRSTSPPTLTSLGVRVMPHVRACLLSYQLAQHDAAADPYRDRNHLRLGAAFSVGEYVVPSLVSAFRREHQEVRISVHVNKNREVIRQLLTQGCDVAILVYPLQDPDYQRLIVTPLLEEEFILVVPPEHPWAQQGSIEAKQLLQESLVLREPGSATRALIDRSFQRLGGWGEYQVVMEMATNEAIKQAIRSGLGVGFISDLSVADDLATDRLAQVRVEGLRITRLLRIARVRSTPVSPATRAFLQFIRRLRRSRSTAGVDL